MSFGDMFKFENFKMSKMWDELKHHPQRALFGGMMDPLSTWIENKTTGSHFTPQSDQLGGAYGGSGVISAFGGGQKGGIYKQAQDAGINTHSGASFENVAHIAAALAGAASGGSALASAYGGGAGSTAGLTEFGTGAGQDASLTALNGGGAASGGSGMGLQQYLRLGNMMRGQGGGGARQVPVMRDWTQPAVDYLPKTQEQLLAEALAKQQNGETYG